MPRDLSFSDTEIVQAFTALSIPFQKRAQITHAANIGLKTCFSHLPTAMTLHEIDQAALRLAGAPYTKFKDRSPTYMDAARGGAFSDPTAHLILHEEATASRLIVTDIRLSGDAACIADQIAHGLTLKNKDHWAFVHELVAVSSVCAEMTGFDSNADLKRLYKLQGLDFCRWADAIHNNTPLRHATEVYLAERFPKPENALD